MAVSVYGSLCLELHSATHLRLRRSFRNIIIQFHLHSDKYDKKRREEMQIWTDTYSGSKSTRISWWSTAPRASIIIFIGISNLFYFRLLWIVFKKGYKSINQFYDNVLPNVNRIASFSSNKIGMYLWIRLCLLTPRRQCISSHKYVIHYICSEFFFFSV